MKHNTLKKILSLLLVICMMAFFAGCIPGEEDPAEPSTIETTGPTESSAGATDGTTAPTDNTDATTSPTEETQAPTEPTEAETDPPATETPNTDPTFATEVPTESPVETFVDVVETVYAISTVNVRSGPSTDDIIVGSLSYGESVQRTGIGNKGWSRVDYNGEEAYVYASYLSTTNPAQDTSGYPGDIWIVVSEGRNADGESAGLTYRQCARLLGEKGCIFGVPLDGGGSSTMVFQGKVLNSAKAGQRSVVDFVYFK